MLHQAEIMDEAAVERALMRISHQIIEKNHGVARLCLMGIRTRGVPLARRIAENIKKSMAHPYPWANWTSRFTGMI